MKKFQINGTFDGEDETADSVARILGEMLPYMGDNVTYQVISEENDDVPFMVPGPVRTNLKPLNAKLLSDTVDWERITGTVPIDSPIEKMIRDLAATQMNQREEFLLQVFGSVEFLERYGQDFIFSEETSTVETDNNTWEPYTSKFKFQTIFKIRRKTHAERQQERATARMKITCQKCGQPRVAHVLGFDHIFMETRDDLEG